MNLQKKMLQEAKITERNSNGENGDPEHLSDEDREALAKPETMIVSALLIYPFFSKFRSSIDSPYIRPRHILNYDRPF